MCIWINVYGLLPDIKQIDSTGAGGALIAIWIKRKQYELKIKLN